MSDLYAGCIPTQIYSEVGGPGRKWLARRTQSWRPEILYTIKVPVVHYENVTMVGNNVTGNNVYYLPFRFRLWKRFHQEADGCSQKHWNHNRKLSELGVRQFFNAATTRQLFRFLWHDKKYDNYLPAGVLMEWPVSIQYWTVMWQAKIFGLRIGSDWSDCVARAQL